MKNQQTTTSFSDVKDGVVLTFTDILEIAIRSPGSKGIDIKDLLLRAPILEVLDKTATFADIHLSHDQWSLVNEIFSSRKWPVEDGVIAVAQALEIEMKVSDSVEPGGQDTLV